jgi:hypothetical protein
MVAQLVDIERKNSIFIQTMVSMIGIEDPAHRVREICRREMRKRGEGKPETFYFLNLYGYLRKDPIRKVVPYPATDGEEAASDDIGEGESGSAQAHARPHSGGRKVDAASRAGILPVSRHIWEPGRAQYVPARGYPPLAVGAQAPWAKATYELGSFQLHCPMLEPDTQACAPTSKWVL